MDPARHLIVGDLEGYAPQVARLVSMMSYVRQTTLDAVAGLGRAGLDHLIDPEANSIGALLLHVAAVEVAYQARTFDGRGLAGDEERRWGAALELGDRGRREIRGHDLDHYTGRLEEVRERTLRELRARDDAWLAGEEPFWGGRPANRHFMWFHVFEDELNHRGQIRWLRRRLPTA
jgi:uncharacterized damage-inducible protein DinB